MVHQGCNPSGGCQACLFRDVGGKARSRAPLLKIKPYTDPNTPPTGGPSNWGITKQEIARIIFQNTRECRLDCIFIANLIWPLIALFALQCLTRFSNPYQQAIEMKSLKRYFRMLGMLAFLAGACHAAPQTNAATIQYIGYYGNGTFFINIDQTITESGCPAARFVVAKTHPNYNQIVALAMSAYLSSKKVLVKTASCNTTDSPNGAYPQIDTSMDSYILFSPGE